VQNPVSMSHIVIENQEAVIQPVITNVASDGLSRGTFKKSFVQYCYSTIDKLFLQTLLKLKFSSYFQLKCSHVYKFLEDFACAR